MKYIIFAHSHCNDGLVAAAIMKYTLQLSHLVEPEVVFVKYGDEQKAINLAKIDQNTIIYCVDFAFNRETTIDLCNNAHKVYVLDHHKTANENLHDLIGNYCNLYLTYDVNKSGASIVYDHCRLHLNLNGHLKLSQREIVAKIVAMVEDRDLWLFRLPMTKEFAEYIFAYVEPNDIKRMTEILFKYDKYKLDKICKLGATIMEYKNNIVDKKVDSYIPTYLTVNSTKLLIINETQPDLVSQLGNELCKKFQMPVCLYRISGSEQKVSLSFRSMDHLEPVDDIARLFSGGGHRNAAAGTCSLDRLTDLFTYN